MILKSIYVISVALFPALVLGNVIPTAPKSVLVSTSTQPQVRRTGFTPSGGDIFRYSVAYANTWGAYRQCMRVEPEMIDYSAYNNVIFSQASVTQQGTIDFNEMFNKNGHDKSYLERMVNHVKTNYDGIKVLISVATVEMVNSVVTPHRFANMIVSKNGRRIFIDSVLKFLQTYNADGIELDLKYPTFTNNYRATESIPKLLQEIREVFTENRKTSEDKYILSVSVYQTNLLVTEEIVYAAKHIDFAILISEDLHGDWEYKKDMPSRMLPHTDINEAEQGLNELINAGFPRNKVVLGISFSGRTYKQENPDKFQIGDAYAPPLFGRADKGICTQRSGYLGYNEIASIAKHSEIDGVRDKFEDPASLTDVMTFGTDQWVTFIGRANVVKWVLRAKHELGVAGVSAVSVDLDDKDHSLSKAIIEGTQLQ